jgi:hypothetical protein
MKNVRRRFTIPEDQLLLAEEYAKFTNRTLAELIVESLFQTRHRHVRKDEKRLQNRSEDRLSVLEGKIEQLTLQRNYREGGEGVRD